MGSRKKLHASLLTLPAPFVSFGRFSSGLPPAHSFCVLRNDHRHCSRHGLDAQGRRDRKRCRSSEGASYEFLNDGAAEQERSIAISRQGCQKQPQILPCPLKRTRQDDSAKEAVRWLGSTT